MSVPWRLKGEGCSSVAFNNDFLAHHTFMPWASKGQQGKKNMKNFNNLTLLNREVGGAAEKRQNYPLINSGSKSEQDLVYRPHASAEWRKESDKQAWTKTHFEHVPYSVDGADWESRVALGRNQQLFFLSFVCVHSLHTLFFVKSKTKIKIQCIYHYKKGLPYLPIMRETKVLYYTPRSSNE